MRSAARAVSIVGAPEGELLWPRFRDHMMGRFPAGTFPAPEGEGSRGDGSPEDAAPGQETEPNKD
jgi:hypothetical protein